MCLSRLRLLASVSALAILAADGTQVRAQERAALNQSLNESWNWWLEGGGTSAGGSASYVGGSAPGLGYGNGAGWEAAIGFDYRLDRLWHLSGQFRYGFNKIASKAASPVASFLVPSDTGARTVPTPGSASASRREDHWLADFMVGREMNIGLGRTQAEVGVRIASLDGQTTGSAIWSVVQGFSSPPPPPLNQNAAFTQTNKFLGAGPRVAVEGSLPFFGGWSFYYDFGVAALLGDRSVVQSVTLFGPNGNPCLNGCPINASSSDFGTVVNFDAEPGISYRLTRNWKLSANYRFDGYWHAVRTFDAANNIVDVNRFYQGAFLRVTYTDYSASGH